jgi:hypothetical protein
MKKAVTFLLGLVLGALLPPATSFAQTASSVRSSDGVVEINISKRWTAATEPKDGGPSGWWSVSFNDSQREVRFWVALRRNPSAQWGDTLEEWENKRAKQEMGKYAGGPYHFLGVARRAAVLGSGQTVVFKINQLIIEGSPRHIGLAVLQSADQTKRFEVGIFGVRNENDLSGFVPLIAKAVFFAG